MLQSEACVVIQSQNQIVATVTARGSREREDWLDALRRLGVADRIT